MELKRLLVQLLLVIPAGELPGGDAEERVVVAFRFALRVDVDARTKIPELLHAAMSAAFQAEPVSQFAAASDYMLPEVAKRVATAARSQANLTDISIRPPVNREPDT